MIIVSMIIVIVTKLIPERRDMKLYTFHLDPAAATLAVSPILCKLQVKSGVSSFCKSRDPAENLKNFWVVAPIYSYQQNKQMHWYRLHDEFRSYMESFGISFCTLELIHDSDFGTEDGSQEFMVTKPGREPYDIQLTYHGVPPYIRENLLNVAIAKLPQDWEYVAWIDAHQFFENTFWWRDGIVKSEKTASVQIFQEIRYKTPLSNTTVYNFWGVLYLTHVFKARQVGFLKCCSAVLILDKAFGGCFGARLGIK
ncbi:MAG: hypothetical protein EOP48_34605 [Sphingobacteriales bacterium]|nr:MAG: hypothetical protein EOP48_34605 [Sphingobacteriales bacterium]